MNPPSEWQRLVGKNVVLTLHEDFPTLTTLRIHGVELLPEGRCQMRGRLSQVVPGSVSVVPFCGWPVMFAPHEIRSIQEVLE